MRNNFEFNLGTFNNAINLKMINFTDLKDRTDDLDQLDKKRKLQFFVQEESDVKRRLNI